jgi:hypothetical protein
MRTTPSRALRAVERDSHTSQKALPSREQLKPAGAICGVVAVAERSEQATFRDTALLSAISNSLIAHDLIC